MSSIMDLIRPELSELSALELENLPYLTLFMGLIRPELSELYTLEFAESDSVYTLASINVNQLVPNIVAIYMTMRS